MLNKHFSVVNGGVLGDKMSVALIGDFNAHHQYWQDKSENKLGELLQEYVESKDLAILNYGIPTKKDNIIDLTVVSGRFSNKISH